MPSRKTLKSVLLSFVISGCGGLLIPGLAVARDGDRPFIDEPVPMSQMREEQIEEYQWAEEQVSLPANPEDGDLLEFRVDQSTGRFRYLLDTSSLELGADGVLRFTLVVESASGARNVMFEGYRCTEREYKTYAFATPTNGFRIVSGAQWQDIESRGSNGFRQELMDSYLCEIGVPLAPEKVIEAVEAGGMSSAHRPQIY